MATYYIDPVNGNDADDGLSWANAFLTLNGAENEPVAAGDTVYVGPGVYRELLTLDVSGGAANEIVYIGDVTGEHTDGVGGIVRITGSDNDTTSVRTRCILGVGRDYRTFRGFLFDMVTIWLVDLDSSPTNIIFEDCVFNCCERVQPGLLFRGDTQSDIVIRRCIVHSPGGTHAIKFSSAGTQDGNHLVENCLFLNGYGRGIESDDVGGITIRNCSLLGGGYGIRVTDALPGGYTAITVENCIFSGLAIALQAINLGEIVEDFNTFFSNATDRNTVAVGGNSQVYPPLLLPPILHSGASQVSGFKFPWWFGELSEWSQIAAITGANEPPEDLRGIVRPVTASKNSWGPHQFMDMEVESGTVQAGSYSRVLHDAGQHLVRRVPVTGVEITVTLYMRFEADYEPDPASLPRMIIKQPGQADSSTVMTAAADNWEQLSDTLTPASLPGYIEVWAESRNTAAAGSYEVFYDTMAVS